MAEEVGKVVEEEVVEGGGKAREGRKERSVEMTDLFFGGEPRLGK